MDKNVEIFEEILASDRLGAYQNYAQNILGVINTDDPSTIWEYLKWNPWLAMAIYDDMEEKDATVFSCLDTRKNNVLANPFRVIPASDKRQDKKIAEFVEETLTDYFGSSNDLDSADESPFDSFKYEALDAVGKGMSIGEIIFAEAKDRIYIKEVKFKPQQLFAFGDTNLAAYSTALMLYPQTGRLRLRSGIIVNDSLFGMELPESKFFVFSYRPRHGNRWGSPLMRKVFWPSWIKRSSIKTWLRYQEKGSGVVIARYNDGAAQDEMNKANKAATAVQEESAVAIPKKFLIEVHEMVRNIGSSHKELVDDFCNAEISRVISGATLTSRGSDGGGSRALGEVHERKEDKIGEVDSNRLAAAITKRIIKPIVFYNFGPDAKVPIGSFEFPADLESKAAFYGGIKKDIGIELSKKQVREDLELDEPVDEEDKLGNPEPANQNLQSEDPLNPKNTSEFAEKKTLKLPETSVGKSNSKTERFTRLRPSMIRFSDK